MAHSFNPFREGPAGEYFVGREEQISHFRFALEGLANRAPGHFYVAGPHGAGKSSYLKRLSDIASKEGFLAAAPMLAVNQTAHENIKTIMSAVVESLDAAVSKSIGNESYSSPIKADWEAGDRSTFAVPRQDHLNTGDIRSDFEKLGRIAKDSALLGIVVCVDEAQWIQPEALSALKNALQDQIFYLVVLSLRLEDASDGVTAAGEALLASKARDAGGDFGAARFYVQGLAIGPFESTEEAEHCINKRLAGHAIQFDNRVTADIARISARIPREVIYLASAVYMSALQLGADRVNRIMLRRIFVSKFKLETRSAIELTAALSNGAKSALVALLEIGKPATVREVARRISPSSVETTLSFVAAGVKAELDALCDSSHCQRNDERYTISDPVMSYALLVALEMTA